MSDWAVVGASVLMRSRPSVKVSCRNDRSERTLGSENCPETSVFNNRKLELVLTTDKKGQANRRAGKYRREFHSVVGIVSR